MPPYRNSMDLLYTELYSPTVEEVGEKTWMESRRKETVDSGLMIFSVTKSLPFHMN